MLLVMHHKPPSTSLLASISKFKSSISILKIVSLATFLLLTNLARSSPLEDNAPSNHFVLDQRNLFQTSILFNPNRTMALFVKTNTRNTQDANTFYIHYI